MAYVDGFIVPVPIKSLPAYRRLSQKAGEVWREAWHSPPHVLAAPYRV